MLEKICPKCSKKIRRTASKCPCGHAFTAGKAKRKAKIEATATVEPEFACGPTTDGGLMLFWPRRNESYILTPGERDLLRAVLVSQPVPTSTES